MGTTLLTIHGTFAPQAPWAQPGSAFCKEMARALQRELTIVPIDWTGHNTFAARLEGAKTLIEKLEQLPVDEQVLLVAHSHGGSVAHYAYAAKPNLFARVDACVCMATPFIGFSIRSGYEALVVGALFTVFIILLQCALFAEILVGHQIWRRFDESTILIISVGMVALSLLVIAAVKIFRRRKKLYDVFGGRIKRATSWDTTSIDVPRLTLVRSMGDEVAVGLAAAQFFCTLTSAMQGLLARMAEWVVRRVNKIWQPILGKGLLVMLACSTIVAGALPAAGMVAFGYAPRYWIDLLWMWNESIDCIVCSRPILDNVVRAAFQLDIVAVLTLEGLCLVFLILLALSWSLSVLAMRGLGAWSPLTALSIQFAVEPAPEGDKRFVNAGWERSADRLKRVNTILNHSNPYLSETALAQIAAVLAEGIENRERSATCQKQP